MRISHLFGAAGGPCSRQVDEVDPRQQQDEKAGRRNGVNRLLTVVGLAGIGIERVQVDVGHGVQEQRLEQWRRSVRIGVVRRNEIPQARGQCARIDIRRQPDKRHPCKPQFAARGRVCVANRQQAPGRCARQKGGKPLGRIRRHVLRDASYPHRVHMVDFNQLPQAIDAAEILLRQPARQHD